MPRLIAILCLVTGVAGGVAAQEEDGAKGGLEMAEFIPQVTDDILLNPRMGLYLSHRPHDAKADDWFMQIADIAYCRQDWATLNPEEGVYEFDEYFGPIFDFWVKQHGKRVAFGVMSESMHSRTKHVTPKWVFDKGVPGVEHVGIRGQEQIDPVFWDERYLDAMCEFIAKLGEYLDGREGLEFIDMRCIGEWGEMHLARWTPQQLEETGHTHTRYVMAYRRMIDAFAEAFPNTQVFLNVGGPSNHTINDYAAIKGMHFRQDGLKPSGASYDCGEWLYKPYSRRGVICNFEFHSGYESMKKKSWDLRATIEKGLQAPISYLNTNLGNYDTLPEEVRELLTHAARKIGYRFVMTKLEHLPEFHLDGARPARIPLMSTWRNDGVAPCYDSFATEWTLLDAAGETVASEVVFPAAPTTRWWPGEEQTANALLRVPAGIPLGDYQLKVAMILPETGKHILLGIVGRDAQDRYDLCKLMGVRGTAPAGPIHEESFEGEAQPWPAAEGMAASIDNAAAHSGEASLLIAGTHEKGWNYCGLRVPTPLMPASKYRLSGWLLVESMEPDGHAPYLKIGVNNAEGKWIENHSSGKYDLEKLGTWQLLQVTAEVPIEAGSADIAIEKGAHSTPITARIRLDDVKLELLEAP